MSTALAPSPRERSGLGRASVEWVKLELLRVAYATRGGFLSVRDPRAVVAWYAIVAISPWFTYSLLTLGLLFGAALAGALAARVGPLLLGLFMLSTIGELVYLLLLVLAWGGDASSIHGLAQAYLKLGVMSLASMAAFASLDPEKICDALLALRAPAFLGFAVAYGFRMVPVLIAEFQTIVDGHLMRRAPIPNKGFLGWRVLRQAGSIAVHAFYPLLLNTAMRTRTTVEALETRGFGSDTASAQVRSVRLAQLRYGPADALLLVATVALIVLAYWLGRS